MNATDTQINTDFSIASVLICASVAKKIKLASLNL
jgi:hypothetical protein